MTAVISSMLFGLRPVQTAVMPVDSSWNTPSVLPAESMAKVSASSSGRAETSKSG